VSTEPYSDDFIRDAAREVAKHGRTPEEVAERLGVPILKLREWVHDFDRGVTVIELETAPSSLAACIRHSYQRLNVVAQDSKLTCTFAELEKNIVEKLNKGKYRIGSVPDYVFQYANECISNEDVALPLTYALIYTIGASSLLKINKVDRGWAFIAEANYHLGCADTAIRNAIASEYLADLDESDHAGKVEGGKVSNANKMKAVVEAIRLLKDRRPETGWKFESEAVKDIVPLMQHFIRTNGIRLSESNLNNLMYASWRNNYTDFKEACVASVAVKKS